MKRTKERAATAQRGKRIARLSEAQAEKKSMLSLEQRAAEFQVPWEL